MTVTKLTPPPNPSPQPPALPARHRAPGQDNGKHTETPLTQQVVTLLGLLQLDAKGGTAPSMLQAARFTFDGWSASNSQSLPPPACTSARLRSKDCVLPACRALCRSCGQGLKSWSQRSAACQAWGARKKEQTQAARKRTTEPANKTMKHRAQALPCQTEHKQKKKKEQKCHGKCAANFSSLALHVFPAPPCRCGLGLQLHQPRLAAAQSLGERQLLRLVVPRHQGRAARSLAKGKLQILNTCLLNLS